MLKPIIFLPGLPASELVRRSTGRVVFPPPLKRMLSESGRDKLVRLLIDTGPGDDLVAGEPIREVLEVAKQAQSLYDILRDPYGYTIHSGQNFRPVGWDWRKAIDDGAVQAAIVRAIQDLHLANQSKVVVIAHSTGGLVLRRLLEQQPAIAEKIEHVIAFGVPWAGTLKAVFYVARGEPFGLPFARLSARQVREIMSHSQAAWDLFPPDPDKTDLVDRSGQPLDLVTDGAGRQIGPLVDHRWMPKGASGAHMPALALRADERLGRRSADITLQQVQTPPITCIAGWGVQTETRCVMTVDGSVSFQRSKEGDGTVALRSASWLRGSTVRSFYLPIGLYPMAGIPFPHSRIWDSPPVREILDQVLKSVPAGPFIAAAVDSDEGHDPEKDVTIRLTAADESGQPLPNATLSFDLFGRNVTSSFRGSLRHEVVIKRAGLRSRVSGKFFRVVMHVTWAGGGSREVPVMFEV